MANDTFAPLPTGAFDLVYADPPWVIPTGSQGCRGTVVEDHYDTVPMKDLARLPVADVCAEKAQLALWVVQSQLTECVEVGEAWGFKYATVLFVWHKRTYNLGFYTMPSVELCLMFTHKRGGIEKTLREGRGHKQFIDGEYRGHSRKPDSARRILEEMYPKARKLELFARNSSPGWTTWGNQTERFAGDEYASLPPVPADEYSARQMGLLERVDG